jgi:hypothetical protein
LKGGKEMKTGRLIKTSDDYFYKIVNVPDEVFAYFEKLSKECEWNNFVIYIGAMASTERIKPDIEIEIYDDFRE